MSPSLGRWKRNDREFVYLYIITYIQFEASLCHMKRQKNKKKEKQKWEHVCYSTIKFAIRLKRIQSLSKRKTGLESLGHSICGYGFLDMQKAQFNTYIGVKKIDITTYVYILIILKHKS